jgi:hypothetical protein
MLKSASAHITLLALLLLVQLSIIAALYWPREPVARDVSLLANPTAAPTPLQTRVEGPVPAPSAPITGSAPISGSAPGTESAPVTGSGLITATGPITEGAPASQTAPLTP